MNTTGIKKGMAALAQLDDDVAKAVEKIGLPEPRIRPAGFETFLSIIISQQISTEAAKAIKGRVVGCMPEMTAEGILLVDDDDLRAAGLSYRKIEYAKGMSTAIVEGDFDVEQLQQMKDEEAIQSITALRGFGRWSAEIYLMFSLGRKDVFPADDLALQVALGKLKQLSEKPTPGQSRDLIQHWSPWRSVGSLFLWHYYRGAPD